MTCANANSATSPRLMASAIRGIAKTYRKISVAISGRATRTDKRAKHDAVLRLVRREILIHRRDEARRQHKRTSVFDAEIQTITHELLEG